MSAEGIDARRILISEGYKPEYIQSGIEVLNASKTLDDLIKEIIKRHFTCGDDQFLSPLYKPLYREDPEVKKAAIQALMTSEFSGEIIDEYFTTQGFDLALIFHLTHDDQFSREEREEFTLNARNVMFNTLKARLCLQTPSEVTNNQN